MISVESDEKQGTVFTVELPVQSCEAVAAEPDTTLVSADSRTTDVLLAEEEELEKGYDSSKPSVLIIDDNEDIRSYVHTLLHTDYTVIEAADGSEGIRKAMKYVPDLIISDVMMPGIDGIKLCQLIKRNLQTCHIPVLLLSAKGSVDAQTEGIQAGADDYIAKPFSIHLLKGKIANQLKARQRLKHYYSNTIDIDTAKMTSNNLDEEFMSKAIQVVEENISNEDFTSDELASQLYMSRLSLIHI